MLRIFSRLKEGLSRTRQQFSSGLSRIIFGKKQIDAALLDEIETQLIMADMGTEAVQSIISSLTSSVQRNQLADPAALIQTLQNLLTELLSTVAKPLTIGPNQKPYVILMVGVNGSGKTTTIGKLAKRLQSEGKSVMLAAGDTFRAAAIDQLQVWGERNQIAVIAQQHGADSASVIFDAFSAAKARNIDVLIADTAGRLHTQTNLMAELEKVKRVITKIDPQAPHEVMLVLDASIGQNALSQAKQFHDSIGLTGITITKLDGTAKGGMIFAIAKQLQLPIRFVGVGEGIEDLQTFNAEDFVSALFNEA